MLLTGLAYSPYVIGLDTGTASRHRDSFLIGVPSLSIPGMVVKPQRISVDGCPLPVAPGNLPTGRVPEIFVALRHRTQDLDLGLALCNFVPRPGDVLVLLHQRIDLRLLLPRVPDPKFRLRNATVTPQVNKVSR